MGIYIKGLDLPKDCDSCDMVNDCTLWHCTDVGERHPECPMTEVKEPHGRLIDADAIIQQAQKYEDEGDTFYLESAEELGSYLDEEAPTIIERSE